jgi:hypothetical protein
MQLPDFYEIFRGVLGWNGDLATLFASTGKSSTASAGKRVTGPHANPKLLLRLTAGESYFATILHSRVRICVPIGEPTNLFNNLPHFEKRSRGQRSLWSLQRKTDLNQNERAVIFSLDHSPLA